MDGSGPRITICDGITISPADARLTRLFCDADPWIESGDPDAMRWVSTALSYALDAARVCSHGNHDAVLKCVAIHEINVIAGNTLPSEPMPDTPLIDAVLRETTHDDDDTAWFSIGPRPE